MKVNFLCSNWYWKYLTISTIRKFHKHDNQQAFYEQVMWFQFTAFDYHNNDVCYCLILYVWTLYRRLRRRCMSHEMQIIIKFMNFSIIIITTLMQYTTTGWHSFTLMSYFIIFTKHVYFNGFHCRRESKVLSL